MNWNIFVPRENDDDDVRVNTCNTRVPTIGGLNHISHFFQGLHIADSMREDLRGDW